ncbi:MFS general substrate transporter [Thozetella sp. PMI_491]|nr:MFS general substrate transporter [Thozetella sp. PMI_491]
MSSWAALGDLIAGLIAWPFMDKYSCVSAKACSYPNNAGWRYTWFTNGAIILVLSLLRVLVIHFHETPKFLLTQGRDEDVVKTLQDLTTKYNRPFSLTVDELRTCGVIEAGTKKTSPLDLFTDRSRATQTCCILAFWVIVGLAYPQYRVFLLVYLTTRGAQLGNSSTYLVYRNYALNQVAGLPAGFAFALLSEVSRVGRKGSLALACLLCFFSSPIPESGPLIRTSSSPVTTFCVNSIYSVLYGYTAESFPSQSRGTGYGLVIACSRFMGIVSAIIATYVNTSTSVPIYICAA